MLALLMRRIYELRLEVSSGALIYIPSFINIGSAIQKSIGRGTHTDTHTDGKVIS
jgi:hypothetical protein